MSRYCGTFIELLCGQITINYLFTIHSYTQNGLLHMLDRNRRIKKQPERFQQCTERFDLIITAEERVYDQVSYYKYFNAYLIQKLWKNKVRRSGNVSIS